MRTLFIVMRLVGYGCIEISAIGQSVGWGWLEWAVSIGIALWCVGDHWKRPDARMKVMRLGIAVETALVLAWAIVIRDGVVLFALLSPLARSCIHLRWRDSAFAMLIAMAGVGLCYWDLETDLTLQLIVLPAAGGYAFVLGVLLKQREQARRMAAISAIERERRAQGEERIRIAKQLHDRTGQYWSAIARALDVALRVEGERRTEFIRKAREASMEGLQEMRAAVGLWSGGQQSPGDWMRFMERSVRRYVEIGGIEIALDLPPELPWYRWREPEEAAETVVRIVIESLTNAIRHGLAEAIRIRLEAGREDLLILVQDNGAGYSLDASTARPAGTGIASMKELAQAYGGSFDIAGQPGRGTTVRVRLPYRAESEEMPE
ncbi:hypothetical protein GXP70_07450 [Paenibacillus lycopersici]|uniref:Oxygen sensor histidine kinase NreB n=1 Tax=Paenibacillus lycopersici TaxID=2704462 RepID=A0A6C0G4J4_9BACL|nr:ATP-binding protein [Paenibacillus lycopersici]QHT59805.1 hypothetical protein GXP70_07450 [Paenibacillus lycopersici]